MQNVTIQQLIQRENHIFIEIMNMPHVKKAQ